MSLYSPLPPETTKRYSNKVMMAFTAQITINKHNNNNENSSSSSSSCCISSCSGSNINYNNSRNNNDIMLIPLISYVFPLI